MKTIWKYTIPLEDYSEVVVKRHSIPLCVHQSRGFLTGEYLIHVWMLVDTDEDEIAYSFFVVGTGHPVPDGVEYIGTIHADDGFVWHIFYAMGFLGIVGIERESQ